MILALVAAVMQPVDPTLPGFYQSATPEVGAAIELDPDGRFMYALDYGAISESAEGTWRKDGNVIRLTPSTSQGTSRGGDLAASVWQVEGNMLLLDRYDINIRFVREGDLALPTIRNEHLEQGK